MLKNSCCHLELAVRLIKGNSPTERFTCQKCATSYRKEGWHWEAMTLEEVIQEIKDVVANQKKIIGEK